ncbi:unnamed protein product [Tilletia caries]|nr:unnamed protein product [Tilletia caries]
MPALDNPLDAINLRPEENVRLGAHIEDLKQNLRSIRLMADLYNLSVDKFTCLTIDLAQTNAAVLTQIAEIRTAGTFPSFTPLTDEPVPAEPPHRLELEGKFPSAFACRNRQVSTASSGASSSTAVDATEEIVDVSTASSGASSSTAVDATEEIVDVEVDRSVQAPVPAAVAASVSTAVPTATVAASTSVPIPAAAAGQHADVIKYTKGIHIDTAEDRGTDLPSFNSRKGKGILIDMLVAPVQPVAEDAYTKMPATSRRLCRVRTPLKSSIRPTFVPSYGTTIEDVVHDAGKLLSVEPGISTMERAVKVGASVRELGALIAAPLGSSKPSGHSRSRSTKSGFSKEELATEIRTQMKEIKARLSAPLETFASSSVSSAKARPRRHSRISVNGTTRPPLQE